MGLEADGGGCSRRRDRGRHLGAVVLVRRREADSWRNAFVALLALLAVTALGLAVFTLFIDAVLEAVL